MKKMPVKMQVNGEEEIHKALHLYGDLRQSAFVNNGNYLQIFLSNLHIPLYYII